MPDQPRILSLTATDLSRDPRVARQRAVLQTCGETWSAGLAPPGNSGNFLPLRQRSRPPLYRHWFLAQLLMRRHAAYIAGRYWLDAPRAGPAEWDLIVANDVEMLPLAYRLATLRTRVLLDAHEYAPREFEDRLYWRVLHQPHRTWLCRTYLPRVHGFVTVCDGIADEYARVFHVARPDVVVNAQPRQPGQPRATSPGRIRLVHHGLSSPSRSIEVMIDLMQHLDPRFTLDLMLLEPDARYARFLRRRAASDPRIVFRPPVPTAEIVAATREYDLGLYLLPPLNFNYRFGLPNKLFEFIQARLGLAVGPSPEMARLVHQHQLGVVAEDFRPATLARHLNRLDAATIDRFKAAAHLAADALAWEAVGGILRRRVMQLLAESRGEIPPAV